MKNKQQFIPIEEITAGQPHKLADAKLETLNRARLDALGEAMKASHECNAADAAVITANRQFLKRERAWIKADRAFWAYAQKGGRK
jgi:predicted transcriptional regulator